MIEIGIRSGLFNYSSMVTQLRELLYVASFGGQLPVGRHRAQLDQHALSGPSGFQPGLQSGLETHPI